MKVQNVGIGTSIRHNGEGHFHDVIQIKAIGTMIIIDAVCPHSKDNEIFTYTYHWDDEVLSKPIFSRG